MRLDIFADMCVRMSDYVYQIGIGALLASFVEAGLEFEVEPGELGSVGCALPRLGKVEGDEHLVCGLTADAVEAERLDAGLPRVHPSTKVLSK